MGSGGTQEYLGVFLVLAGNTFVAAGRSGPGILTILLGLIMLDIPGKAPAGGKDHQAAGRSVAANRLSAQIQLRPLIMD